MVAMPITRSAKKAHRQSLRRRAMNRSRKDRANDAVKGVKKLISEGKKKEALTLLSAAQKALDKAAKEHSIDKNTASRKKSRLAKRIAKLS